MEVVSSGDRDPDAEGMEGLSSSRMRLAAAEGDFKTFRAGLPEGVPRKSAMELFDTVRQSMNVKEIKEFWNIWEIAPKYDPENLREAIVNAKTPSGVPATQRLVGTDAHRKYVETMVPGISYGKQFINKYKVRK